MNYLILGAGPAGVVAAETLRNTDPDGAITLVGAENEPPYSRMAIPYLLTGRIDERGTHLRKEPGWYKDRRIDVTSRRATAVHPGSKTVAFADGTSVPYDRLLIATGARPLRPAIPGLDLPGVHTCWTLDDARYIMDKARPGARVVLMGAGFIGSIVLEALAERGVTLTVVEMGDRMVPRMMNPTAGGMIKNWCRSKGVEVLTSTRILGIEANGGQAKGGFLASLFRSKPANGGGALAVTLDNGHKLEADLVVISAGVRPNIEFLADSGIVMDVGIQVDEHMRSSAPDVYAAGDVAQGKDISTGHNNIHAIQPTATEHGRIAALNMAGRPAAYKGSLQMNVLDTLGLISSSFGLWMGVEGGEAAEVIDTANYKYLRLEFADDRMVGATAIGLTQHVGVLRGLIQTGVQLGPWKQRLMADPHRVMEAYLARTQA